MSGKIDGYGSGTGTIKMIDDADVGRSDEIASEAKADLESQLKDLDALAKKFEGTFTIDGQQYSKITHKKKKKADPKAQAEIQKLTQQKMDLMQRGADPMAIMMIDQQINQLASRTITVAVQLTDEEIQANIAAEKAELTAEQQAEVAEAKANDPKYLDISEVFTRAWEGDIDLPQYPHLNDIPEAQREKIMEIVEKIEGGERDVEKAETAMKTLMAGGSPASDELDALKLEIDNALFQIVKNKGEWDGIFGGKSELLNLYQAGDRDLWDLHELATSDAYLANLFVKPDFESALEGLTGQPEDFAALKAAYENDENAQRIIDAWINSQFFSLTFDENKDDVLGEKIQDLFEDGSFDGITDPKELLTILYGAGVKYEELGAAEIGELPHDGKIKSIDFNILEGVEKNQKDQFKFFLEKIGIKEDTDVAAIFSLSSTELSGISTIDDLIDAYTSQKLDPNVRRAINCALANSELGFDLTFNPDDADFASRIIYEKLVNRGEDLKTVMTELFTLGASGLHVLEDAATIADLDDIYYTADTTTGEKGELTEAGFAKLEAILDEKERMLEDLGLEDYIDEVTNKIFDKVFRSQKDTVLAKLVQKELKDSSIGDKLQWMKDFRAKYISKFGGQWPPRDINSGQGMMNLIRLLANSLPSLKKIQGSEDATKVEARQALIDVMDVILARTPLMMIPGAGEDSIQVMDRKKDGGSGNVWTENEEHSSWTVSDTHADANFDIWAEKSKAYIFHTSDTANVREYQTNEGWSYSESGESV